MKKITGMFLFLILPVLAFSLDLQPVMTYGKDLSPVTALDFSPDSRFILSGHFDNMAIVWDLATGKEMLRVSTPAKVAAVKFSPDGKRFLTSSLYSAATGGTKSLTLWDLQSGKKIIDYSNVMTYASAVAFSPDGKYIMAGIGGVIKVYPVNDKNEAAVIKAHSAPIMSIAAGEKSKFIVSGAMDGKIAISEMDPESWKKNPGIPEPFRRGNMIKKPEKPVTDFTAHEKGVRSTAIFPDGKKIISCGSDKNVKIWDLMSGRLIKTLEGHTDIVYTAVVSNDSVYAVSASRDQSVRIWHIRTGREILKIPAHDGIVYSAIISPDGKFIISGGIDKLMKLWKMPDKK